MGQRATGLAVALAALGAACASGRPPALASDHVVFALGEGGGVGDHDIVLVTDLGDCEYDYRVYRPKGVVERKRARARLREETYRDLFTLLDDVKFYSMPESLSDKTVLAGGHWFIDARKDGVWKRVSLENVFPVWAHHIEAFVHDNIVRKTLAPTGEPLPDAIDLSADDAQALERAWAPPAASP